MGFRPGHGTAQGTEPSWTVLASMELLSMRLLRDSLMNHVQRTVDGVLGNIRSMYL